MTKTREEQVCLEATSFYHCYVRCVRRAFLCGDDFSTGENYDHRKQWIVSRLKFLSYIYAIDICAYAVMSNHYHVVLHVDKARADSWSDEEVVERWLQLYNGTPLVNRWLQSAATMDDAELLKVKESIDLWRERLSDISWFMRGVNETIARMANAEENCKGRFWEGRFKSQALLDEAALLTCMAYVDLNPVRAGMEDDLINSDFTSIQQRLFDLAQQKQRKTQADKQVAQRIRYQQQLQADLDQEELPQAPLMAFDGSSHTNIHDALPFTAADYLALVDNTGRMVREDKRGAIDNRLVALVSRVGIEPDEWLEHVKHFGRRYGYCAGKPQVMQDYAKRFNLFWCKGVAASSVVYAT